MEGSATTSERPSFAQAFASDASATGSLPATTPTTDSSAPDPASADATALPGTPEPTTDSPSTTDVGPIPLERHKQILDGVYKERDDAKTQLDSWKAFEWAKTVDRQAVEQAQRLGQLYTTDRPAFWRQFATEAAADPSLRSEAARILATRGGPQAPSMEPDIPVYNEQGQLVSKTFSAERQVEIINHLVAEALGKEVAPLKQDFQTRQQEREQTQFQQELQTSVADIYAEAQDVLPGFTEHEAEIGKVFATLTGKDPAKDLRQAWKTVVGPKLSAKATADVLDNLQKKAAAASGVNPAGAVIATNKRPTSLTDPSLKW